MIKDKTSLCLLCGVPTKVVLSNMADNRYGSPGEYSIAKCHNCGLLRTIPVPDPERLKQLYETYYNFGGEKGTIYTKFRDVFFSSFGYRTWMVIDGDVSFHSRRGQGRLLDIGCNEGRGLLIYRHNGFNPEGLELNEKAAQDVRMAGFTVYTETLEEFNPEEPFDIVVLSNVLEHAPNPKNMLENVRRILKSGGHVWISCPNNRSWLRRVFGRSWINWHVPFHLFHFSNKTLGQLLQISGFKITELRYATPSHWVSQSAVTAISAKRGRKIRHLRTPLIVACLMLFCRFVLFPLLWVGNLTGHGDCLIIKAISK